MAAVLNPEWLSCLPSLWSYGVTRDGRVFFINEEGKSTTWLHPVTGEAVITGHRKTPDLPTGWEEGYTFEGARCFIKNSTASQRTLRCWICCGRHTEHLQRFPNPKENNSERAHFSFFLMPHKILLFFFFFEIYLYEKQHRQASFPRSIYHQ
ncbi:pleckstrin homology domain-containing family A member 5 isoform X19 [Carassius gibelio]|nr:pleckstrin homology domain-containing family A member 5 isoform X19 [Carassius gibelio]XP_052439582.1 pleckstrin homology domain-containing family A member 5 isoform X19 [Carassius gibelio]